VCCERRGKGEGKEGRKKKRGKEETPMPPLGRGSHFLLVLGVSEPSHI